MTETKPELKCRHCGETIVWDDWSYVHEATGFADCNVTITGGESIVGGVVVNPIVMPTRTNQTYAEPKASHD